MTEQELIEYMGDALVRCREVIGNALGALEINEETGLERSIDVVLAAWRGYPSTKVA